MSDLADELERRAKLLREARDGTKDEPRSPLATQMALAADVGWAVERNLSAILAALRAEPDAGEVERAAKALGRALEDAGIPNAAKDDWTAEARAALTAARTPPTLTETVAACRALPWPGDGHD